MSQLICERSTGVKIVIFVYARSISVTGEYKRLQKARKKQEPYLASIAF